MFTIAVDTVVNASEELSLLASDPICSHAFSLSDLYDVIPLTRAVLTSSCTG